MIEKIVPLRLLRGCSFRVGGDVKVWQSERVKECFLTFPMVTSDVAMAGKKLVA